MGWGLGKGKGGEGGKGPERAYSKFYGCSPAGPGICRAVAAAAGRTKVGQRKGQPLSTGLQIKLLVTDFEIPLRLDLGLLQRGL